ncbi:HAD hydrolase-like protein [Viridibacillus sp. YIM B01967]|uniref:HAD hydrolase-like protein n=1 Tax=Viridibacillus soli TaxID=2798301 RepID=A0ABS1H4A6_9BACL|nr:HAD hydrolase-like protein [Viridibacillus soli]MBK3494255.1 HAD hydrolase-like protein [Viridibacillus soli]
MNKTIIFDMDGTLFQTNLILEPALETTFNVLRNRGLWNDKTPIEEYREIMGVPLPVVWETLLPQHSQKIRSEANTVFHEQLVQHIQAGNGALYEGVEATLESLANNYDLYIASNGQVEYLQAIVEKYRLDRWIKRTYSIQEIMSDSKSELVKGLVLENNISYGCVVGDRISDIKAAKDNQLIAIGCQFDFAKLSELEQADFVIQHISEVTSIIRVLFDKE